MIRAEIVNNVYACGTIKAGNLLALCRKLIATGHDPAARLEAYRGEMLCLRVRSIGEGAQLVADRDGGAAPPVDERAAPVGRRPSGPKARHGPPLGLAGTPHRRDRLRWDGDRLLLSSGRLIATVEADAEWPTLCRVRTPDGRPSDMVNRTRAKDAATTLALAVLNREEVSTKAA